MSFMRRFFRGIMAWVLSFSLFVLAGTVALLLTAGNPGYIKAILADSGVYKTFIRATLDLASYQNSSQGSDAITTQTTNEILPIIGASITPSFLQKTSESMIDSIFLWLRGDIKTPNISIKTAEMSDQLQSKLTEYLNTRVASLPVCTQSDATQGFDPLSDGCKPKGAVNQADIQKVAADFVDSIPVLQKGEITMQSIDPNNVLATSSVGKSIPVGYAWFERVPYIAIALIVASGIALVILGTNRTKNWRTIGHTFVWAGALLIVTGGVTVLFAGVLNSGLTGSASAQQILFVKNVFVPIMEIFTKSLGSYSLYFGVGYAVIGAGCYAISHKLRIIDVTAPTVEPAIATDQIKTTQIN